MTGLQEAGARARAPPLPSAAAIGNVLPLTLRSNSRRRPVRLCPSPDSGLWGGPSVQVFVGGHRQLARRRVTNEKNVARGVIRHQRLQR